MEFTIIPDKHKVYTPIFGIDLFSKLNVCFGKEDGRLVTAIKD